MKIKLLFLVTEDWYFWSHRLPLARAARDAGMEVYVMARVNRHADAIREEGFRLIPWKGIVPGGVNPFRELRALAEVVKQYRSIRPDLVHHVHNKPILYGGLAARFCRIPALNTVAGLGHVFADTSLRMRALKSVLLVLFRFALKDGDRSLVAFQNSDDLEYFLDKQINLPNSVPPDSWFRRRFGQVFSHANPFKYSNCDVGCAVALEERRA